MSATLDGSGRGGRRPARGVVVSVADRTELVELRRRTRVLETENEILKRAAAYFARENVRQEMTYAFIAQDCPDLPVATCCRVMKVSSSGFYAWRADPVSQRDLDDAYLTNTIVDIHRMSRGSYGSPRVHAERRLGDGVPCGHKRVERLMRHADRAAVATMSWRSRRLNSAGWSSSTRRNTALLTTHQWAADQAGAAWPRRGAT